MIYLLSTLIGIASWYGSELEGQPTASGELFDPAGLTAASWHHPIGTWVEVTNSATGQVVVVRINDRGPARRLGRLIDLSQAGYAEIADPATGLVTVKVRVVHPSPAAEKPTD